MARKVNGHAKPFGLLSRLFRDDELELHDAIRQLRDVPEELHRLRCALESGELHAEDLDFDSDEGEQVEPEQERKP